VQLCCPVDANGSQCHRPPCAPTFSWPFVFLETFAEFQYQGSLAKRHLALAGAGYDGPAEHGSCARRLAHAAEDRRSRHRYMFPLGVAPESLA
jgi:hypothetical protein